MTDPMDCKHRHNTFVQGGSDSNGNRHDVRVCMDCGLLTVGGRTDEHHTYNIRVLFWNRETVEALLKPSKLIEEDDLKRERGTQS